MPLEYYLGGAVALIVLVLLVMALTGKKKVTRRVVVAKPSDNEELTRQVKRAADALEALLAHLKAHPLQAATPVQQPVVAPTPSQRAATQVPVPPAPPVAVHRTPEPVAASSHVDPIPVASEPPTEEPAATAEVAADTPEQKPRRVKLSMFGR